MKAIHTVSYSSAVKGLACTFLLVLFLTPNVAYANFSFNNTPLKEVIQTIQQETSYYFLYRESQVADIRITLNSDKENIINNLEQALTETTISLSIDAERNQILLTRKQAPAPLEQRAIIRGQVVDGSTGERLPFAAITWLTDGQFSGISTNSSGRFTIHEQVSGNELTVEVSYIGYQNRTVRIDLSEDNRIHDFTIRLDPKAVQGNEIIVSGFSGYSPSDTLLTGMIDAAQFSPLGESNSIRALQAHPSVSKGTALNNGINVRGSTPDGFLVLLDGMSIFNQSHLFGLLDSFNEDAIQSSGYHFGITPANIETPTGGTLNLITRTGSRNEFKNRIGISNTSISGTFEGPVDERTSWLLSARTSYIDQISWFNNSQLIQWGLDIDRPRRIATDDLDFTDLVLQPGAASAQFIDLHGKLYHETSRGGRLILSGYFGGDRTSQLSTRRTRASGGDGQFEFVDVETSNRWGNSLVSLKYEKEIFGNIYSSSMAGFSSYQTDFDKDDFVYAGISSESGTESTTIFTYPFRNRSSMNEFNINQEFEYFASDITATLGTSWRYYRGDYGESSFDRPSFFTQSSSHAADVYLQTEWNPIELLQLNAGSRLYYFSGSEDLLISPRAQLQISPKSYLTISGGYAINYQFLHRVSLKNATTADVWVLSTSDQPPASSRQFMAGIEFVPSSYFYLKAEAYQKQSTNLRIHELNTQSLENTFSGTPWFFQNEGSAKGVELILRNRWNKFTLTQSYTLSRMMFENNALLDGEPFFADWDRTHAYNTVLESRITDQLRSFLSWTMMSGAPNSLATFGAADRERLDSYYRLDFTLSYQREFGASSILDASFSVFNLLNRDNVWYRDYAFNFDESRSIPRLRPVAVDVLDLGFHPSFNLSYSF